jgi:hypothetical protein
VTWRREDAVTLAAVDIASEILAGPPLASTNERYPLSLVNKSMFSSHTRDKPLFSQLSAVIETNIFPIRLITVRKNCQRC